MLLKSRVPSWSLPASPALNGVKVFGKETKCRGITRATGQISTAQDALRGAETKPCYLNLLLHTELDTIVCVHYVFPKCRDFFCKCCWRCLAVNLELRVLFQNIQNFTAVLENKNCQRLFNIHCSPLFPWASTYREYFWGNNQRHTFLELKYLQLLFLWSMNQTNSNPEDNLLWVTEWHPWTSALLFLFSDFVVWKLCRC